MNRKTAQTGAIGAAILCLLLSGGCAGREPADEPSAVQESTEETPKADKGNQTEERFAIPATSGAKVASEGCHPLV